MRGPARVKDVGVVVVGNRGAEEQADCVDCEEEFAEHGEGGGGSDSDC